MRIVQLLAFVIAKRFALKNYRVFLKKQRISFADYNSFCIFADVIVSPSGRVADDRAFG